MPRRRTTVRILLSSGLSLVALVAACQRTPEPAPSPSALVTADRVPAPSEHAVHAPVAAKPDTPCVLTTPEAPPPPVGAAPRDRCPKEPESAAALPVASVSIATGDGGSVKVQAELAKAPKETERGLMYRTKMEEDHGMLFALGERREHPFWMHNTCIPLDMMWIDDDGRIVGLLENVPTLNDEERTVGCPSSWVLEVNAGWARRHGVRAGQKLTLPPH